MKKMLMAALTVGVMSTSALATDGTVDWVRVLADGTVQVRIMKADSSVTNLLPLAATGDSLKAMTALAITAKTSGAEVSANYGTNAYGTGWIDFTLK